MFKPLFTSPIDDKIVRLLSAQSYRTTVLFENLLKETTISRQSFYEALRRLANTEVIVVNKKLVSLNKVWIEQLIQFTQETARTYNESYRMESQYLQLQPGERVSYTFKSLEAVDVFVSHATLLILEQSDKRIPSAVYNPHHWFFVARPSSEIAWWKAFERLGVTLYLTNGGKTDADKQVGTIIKSKSSKYVHFSLTDKELFKKNNFVSVYGTSIFEIQLEEKVGQEIDQWFRETKDIEQGREKLQQIVKKISKVKLIISHNPKRAEILRKRMMKYFL